MKLKKISRISRAGLKQGYAKADYESRIKAARELVKSATASNPVDKNKMVEAIGLYQQALDINSSKAEPYIALAYISWKFGETEDAVALLKTVKKQIPHNLSSDELMKQIEKDFHKNKFSQKNKTTLEQDSPKLKNRVKRVNSLKPNQYDNMFSGLKNIKK